MQPVVLLVGKLPGIVGHLADELEDLPVRWLGAHDHGEVMRQLDTEPSISCVIMGAGLNDDVRGDLVGLIAGQRPDVSIHLKDRASGPEGMADFVRKVAGAMVLNRG
ncbi:hypothetical protein AB0T83_19480 [Fluviibacterium sp. DFM31]|uniref:Uncharacterized protein n=1 Tax=Meridianimarinicoccus marinus TaxID=3231483 RepID=A0ABV3LD44_9RHOB